MSYDFDAIPDRRGSSSQKWDTGENRSGHDGLIPMWIADMDFRIPPEVEAALVERVRHGVFGYTMVPTEFREGLRSWMSSRHGFDVPDDWVVVTPGVMPALSMLIEELTEPGSGVVIQPPVYYPFSHAISSLGRKVVDNPLRVEGLRYTMDLDHLESVLAAGASMVVLCSPHNPVARVWTPDEIGELVSLCERYGTYLVSDEIHLDLIVGERSHTPILRDFGSKRIVELIAATKTFNLAGLPVSCALVPDGNVRLALERTMKRRHATLTNTLALSASTAAYHHGGPWLDELLAYLSGNDEYLRRRLGALPLRISAPPLEGTYLEWIDFRELDLEQTELESLIYEKAGVRLSDGMLFGTEGRGFLRMNIATTRPLLAEALDRIEQALVDSSSRKT